MTLQKFIKQYSSQDNPVGDLANDILVDTNFPTSKSDNEIFEYLDFQTRQGGTNDVFQKFWAEYQKTRNATLKHILKFLYDNSITSIEIAMKKNIAMSYVETCGYIIKIPVENDFPSTVLEDLNQLEKMNEKYIEISSGEEVQSHLLTKPHINEGMNITFCCQEPQFEFLLSLI